MNKEVVKDSIAYCGLICSLCFQGQSCKGCKSPAGNCDMDLSDQGCFQKECCLQQGFNGCWECNDLAGCSQAIFHEDDRSKVKAFALFIQQHGIDPFIHAIAAIIDQGFNIEKGRDLDGLQIKEVHSILQMTAQGNGDD